MSTWPLCPSLPHARCAQSSSKAVWVVQCSRGSAVHLSRALELISVQINCFSCILVTGISPCLRDLLGGREGGRCVSMCPRAEDQVSGLPTWEVPTPSDRWRRLSSSLGPYASDQNLRLVSKSPPSCNHRLHRLSCYRTHTHTHTILQGKPSTCRSISYQLSLETSTWLTHSDVAGTRRWRTS